MTYHEIIGLVGSQNSANIHSSVPISLWDPSINPYTSVVDFIHFHRLVESPLQGKVKGIAEKRWIRCMGWYVHDCVNQWIQAQNIVIVDGKWRENIWLSMLGLLKISNISNINIDEKIIWTWWPSKRASWPLVVHQSDHALLTQVQVI